ncbi:GNAT superfamily N-acetyltransferase [Streptosporangium album]|uniref:GNAT superfamily N-acetyltransferase n=1 Tax=Streptosporangium album TaxID=47479 RepID=A0A7W7RUP2_9ACTN|nr:GNAT family N-acetyltransferase [Streptosporangium album]MBB4937736.1 GNAT superfamily N-acetyltransferase [Streptosporangium album]
MFVHPDSRGQGIARALLTDMVADWPAAWLITSTEAPAAGLYRNMGWREAGHLAGSSRLPLAVFTHRSNR